MDRDTLAKCQDLGRDDRAQRQSKAKPGVPNERDFPMSDARVGKVAEAILQYLKSHPDAGLYDESPIDGVGFDGELNLLDVARVAIEALDAEAVDGSLTR